MPAKELAKNGDSEAVPVTLAVELAGSSRECRGPAWKGSRMLTCKESLERFSRSSLQGWTACYDEDAGPAGRRLSSWQVDERGHAVLVRRAARESLRSPRRFAMVLCSEMEAALGTAHYRDTLRLTPGLVLCCL